MESKMQYIFPLPMGKSFVVTPSINMMKQEIVFDCMESGNIGDLVKIGTLVKGDDLTRISTDLIPNIINDLKDGLYTLYAKKSEVGKIEE